MTLWHILFIYIILDGIQYIARLGKWSICGLNPEQSPTAINVFYSKIFIKLIVSFDPSYHCLHSLTTTKQYLHMSLKLGYSLKKYFTELDDCRYLGVTRGEEAGLLSCVCNGAASDVWKCAILAFGEVSLDWLI